MLGKITKDKTLFFFVLLLQACITQPLQNICQSDEVCIYRPSFIYKLVHVSCPARSHELLIVSLERFQPGSSQNTITSCVSTRTEASVRNTRYCNKDKQPCHTLTQGRNSQGGGGGTTLLILKHDLTCDLLICTPSLELLLCVMPSSYVVVVVVCAPQLVCCCCCVCCPARMLLLLCVLPSSYVVVVVIVHQAHTLCPALHEIGRASCRERV